MLYTDSIERKYEQLEQELIFKTELQYEDRMVTPILVTAVEATMLYWLNHYVVLGYISNHRGLDIWHDSNGWLIFSFEVCDDQGNWAGTAVS